jgi:hypothetical protein
MFVQQWRDGPDLTPARDMVEGLHDWGLSDAVIALLIASTQGTIIDLSPCLKAGDSWAEHRGPGMLARRQNAVTG